MAQLNVPSGNSYKYTSYATLKGCDFSNDPSRVDRTRSPDCLNMISDNGGNPVKRKGWEVMLAAKFVEGGETYFGRFENVFDIGRIIGEMEANDENKMCYFNDSFTEITRVGANHTPGKARQVYNNALVTFDNGYRSYRMTNGALVEDTEATVPNTLFAADPETGAGQTLQGSNLLNSKRTYKYIWGGDYHATWKGTCAYSGLPASFKEGDAWRITTAGTSHGITWAVGDLAIATMTGSGDYWMKVSPKIKVVIPTGSALDTSQCTLKRLCDDGEMYTAGGITWSGKLEANGITYYEAMLPNSWAFGQKMLNSYPTVTGTDNIEIELVFSTESQAFTDGARRLKTCTASCIFKNRIFLGGCTEEGYENRVWYTEAGDPSYVPDTNYIITSGDVMGFSVINDTLAVIKKGQHTNVDFISETALTDTMVDSSGNSTTSERIAFKMTEGTAGVGAVNKKCFANLWGEPLFLSRYGVMGITTSNASETKIIRNRSYFVDKKLLAEPHLENAVAEVHKNYYIVAVNGHAYVLDARQKASDIKGNTSYLYEAYYWDNIPAENFASDGEHLYFTMTGKNGVSRLCRFKDTGKVTDYSDGTQFVAQPSLIDPNMLQADHVLQEDGSFHGQEEYGAGVQPIVARWATIFDSDYTMAYTKTLQKKGTGCSVIPYERSSVTAFYNADDTGEKIIGTMYADKMTFENIDFSRFTFNSSSLARDYYFRKKEKKYKRLQIGLMNDAMNEPFGILEIYKTYVIGNFAKH